MNLILQNLLDNAEKRKENNSSPPFPGKIRAEKQDRPLPVDLAEQQDIPYGDPAAGLRADVVYPKHRETETLPVVVFVHGGALVTGDRKSDRVFCQEFARRGFVVFSVEYRLVDRTDAFGMVSDLCEALAMVKTMLRRFGGDPCRVSLCGESAGAFLSIYAAAVQSDAIRRLFGCREYGLTISRLILFSGMIYTTENNPIGLVYRKELYREKSGDRAFLERIAPDNPEIMSLLPPIFLVSSKADFLRGHTLNYAGALKHNSHEYRLLYFPAGKELTHAFPALLPSLPESGDVLDAILDWMKG
ncbi:MAG: alpha/beta hydrolase [Oscillospiraceae bacterium]|nr:alpha/beta hydrolase [Oscillospiraceae bacterium]